MNTRRIKTISGRLSIKTELFQVIQEITSASVLLEMGSKEGVKKIDSTLFVGFWIVFFAATYWIILCRQWHHKMAIKRIRIEFCFVSFSDFSRSDRFSYLFVLFSPKHNQILCSSSDHNPNSLVWWCFQFVFFLWPSTYIIQLSHAVLSHGFFT